jgi:cysteinyl-tRNA synthetase
MSKSEGNFYTINELLETDNFGGRKWPGEVLRLAMLMTHYREPIDFSASRLREAETVRSNWLGPIARRGNPDVGVVDQAVVDALSDDLDTSKMKIAIDALVSRSRNGDNSPEAQLSRAQAHHDLAKTLLWLGLAEDEDFEAARGQTLAIRKSIEAATVGLKSSDIEQRIAERLAFIREKNWTEADRIRDELLAQGIQLKDGKDPITGERITTWEVKR